MLKWASLFGKRGGDEGLTLHDSHITVTEESRPFGPEQEREVAHVWTPASWKPTVCALCHQPLSVSTRSPAEIERAEHEGEEE